MNEVAQPAPTMANSWSELNLDPGGRSLIEASAGTGKTWTIAVLYLRLLLEQQRSPTEIVVTTFTDAAAQELRERIRGKILWAEQLARVVRVESSTPGNVTSLPTDEFWLRQRWQSDAGDVGSDLNRLRLALADLDRAPIGTLHSLCRRILSDLPFDSASPFELGDMVSSDSIDGELADDLLRRLGQGSAPLSTGDREWWATAGNLRTHLRKVLAAGIEIQQVTLEQIADFMRPENAAMLRAEIGDGSHFKRSNSKLRTRLEVLAAFIEGADFHAACPATLAELPDVVDGDLTTQLKPDAVASSRCADAIKFVQSMSKLIEFLPFANRAKSLTEHQAELRLQRRRRLAARGQVTFDELIERVARVLADERNTLADQLFASWPVAMIDEFQDTDAQQYGILDRIYRHGDGSPRGRLVMIGDPKQAIYRFRGGDIEAYLEAKKSATAMLTLGENFRSSKPLVGAVNTWFKHVGQGLSSKDDRIGYEHVEASDRRDAAPYRIDGETCIAPLHVHYWEDDVPVAAEARRDAALTACANHIVDLLGSGQHRIGGELLKPGDIAVLLPANHHIHSLRDLLIERGVPCVATARSSVLESDWAREVHIILHAALHAGEPGAVRAALATRLGGKTYDALRALTEQPDALQSEARLFLTMGELWSTQGVLAALQYLLAERAALLFGNADSERAMTDLRHIGELLQARSEELIGQEELLQWLAEQRSGDSDDGADAADEMQLRIESDAARVRLMTLHASKGLEFPIVMLPLMWSSITAQQDSISVLYDEARKRRVLSFGAAAKKRYQQMGQDERFRLLYVAMTRARHACHIYALPPDRPASAKSVDPASDPQRAPLDAMIEKLLETGVDPTRLDGIAWSRGAWRWTQRDYTPEPNVAADARNAMTEPPPARFETKYSFTALTQKQASTLLQESAAADEPGAGMSGFDDVVASSQSPEAAHAELQRLELVAGREFGNAVHAMFELRDIHLSMSKQQALIRRCLLDEGVRLGTLEIDSVANLLARRIQSTLDTSLLPDVDPTLTLAGLKAHQQRAEMAFDFVLDDISMVRLRQAGADYGEPDLIPQGTAYSLRGLMTGKIDLVFEHAGRFHVLDYKSNFLGTLLSSYQSAVLRLAMDDHHYRFQALLYTIAVDRYLRQRIANYSRREHLGEAIYLFIRAIGIAPGSGIWAQRFDDGLIDAVDAVLGGRAHQEAA